MMTTHFSNMSLSQHALVNMVHEPKALCGVCGGGYNSTNLCGANPKSVSFVGNAQRGVNHKTY